MVRNNRREFLGEIGRGMLLAGLGTTLASELRLATAADVDATLPVLDFGAYEPLVALMQETAPAELTPKLVEKIKSGTDLKTLVAAAALANARTFGGEDYIGFHTFMALAPAYRMAQELPKELAPLPVLKVLYRNANRIQEFGGRKSEVLHPVEGVALPSDAVAGEYVREATRRGDVNTAEARFATIAAGDPGEAFNHLQFTVEDEINVHRVALAWRAWETLDIVGPAWAHSMLRQSIRFCAKEDGDRMERHGAPCAIRTLLPSLLDQYHLLGRALGTKSADDAWIEQLAKTMFRGTHEQAADAAAQALAEGFSPEAVGEAMALAANMLVLHDPGRPEKWASPGKPAGSCHGDSIGVHASDAANAWRNIARVSNPRNTVASLIVGAYHTAGQSEWSNAVSYPLAEQLEAITTEEPKALLATCDEAIRAGDQFRAAAAMARYGAQNQAPEAAFAMLLRFGTSEDGALHAEKYYNTVREEFAQSRPAFRWNQLVALARVTASEYGRPAPGYAEARALLGV
ncbi:MAG: hypothetical protein K2Y37_23780 [Pirellulales bacterium]|nr:hypothetical protein [Pirellulales bacterium]